MLTSSGPDRSNPPTENTGPTRQQELKYHSKKRYDGMWEWPRLDNRLVTFKFGKGIPQQLTAAAPEPRSSDRRTPV